MPVIVLHPTVDTTIIPVTLVARTPVLTCQLIVLSRKSGHDLRFLGWKGSRHYHSPSQEGQGSAKLSLILVLQSLLSSALSLPFPRKSTGRHWTHSSSLDILLCPVPDCPRSAFASQHPYSNSSSRVSWSFWKVPEQTALVPTLINGRDACIP